jgi:hypothetical protein
MGRDIMKMTIEVQVPAGTTRAEVEGAVKRAFDPDWVADWWNIEDIREQYCGDGDYYDLSDDDCRRILKLMENNKDASIGFNWDYVAECTEEITG